MCQIFHFHGQMIRVVRIDVRPWFIAADVCPILFKTGGSVPNTKHLPHGEVRTADPHELVAVGLSTTRRLILVSEAGLFALIAKSNTGKREDFESWVTNEVLPTLCGGVDPSPVNPLVHPKVHLLCKHIEIGNRKATPRELANPSLDHMYWTGARKPGKAGKTRLVIGSKGASVVTEFPKPITKIGGKHIHPVKLIMGVPPFTAVKNMCGHPMCVNPLHYRTNGEYRSDLTTKFMSPRAEEKTMRVVNSPLREALVNNERPWIKNDKEIKKFIDDLEYQGLSINIYRNCATIRE